MNQYPQGGAPDQKYMMQQQQALMQQQHQQRMMAARQQQMQQLGGAMPMDSSQSMHYQGVPMQAPAGYSHPQTQMQAQGRMPMQHIPQGMMMRTGSGMGAGTGPVPPGQYYTGSAPAPLPQQQQQSSLAPPQSLLTPATRPVPMNNSKWGLPFSLLKRVRDEPDPVMKINIYQFYHDKLNIPCEEPQKAVNKLMTTNMEKLRAVMEKAEREAPVPSDAETAMHQQLMAYSSFHFTPAGGSCSSRMQTQQLQLQQQHQQQQQQYLGMPPGSQSMKMSPSMAAQVMDPQTGYMDPAMAHRMSQQQAMQGGSQMMHIQVKQEPGTGMQMYQQHPSLQVKQEMMPMGYPSGATPVPLVAPSSIPPLSQPLSIPPPPQPAASPPLTSQPQSKDDMDEVMGEFGGEKLYKREMSAYYEKLDSLKEKFFESIRRVNERSLLDKTEISRGLSNVIEIFEGRRLVPMTLMNKLNVTVPKLLTKYSLTYPIVEAVRVWKEEAALSPPSPSPSPEQPLSPEECRRKRIFPRPWTKDLNALTSKASDEHHNEAKRRKGEEGDARNKTDADEEELASLCMRDNAVASPTIPTGHSPDENICGGEQRGRDPSLYLNPKARQELERVSYKIDNDDFPPHGKDVGDIVITMQSTASAVPPLRVLVPSSYPDHGTAIVLFERSFPSASAFQSSISHLLSTRLSQSSSPGRLPSIWEAYLATCAIVETTPFKNLAHGVGVKPLSSALRPSPSFMGGVSGQKPRMVF